MARAALPWRFRTETAGPPEGCGGGARPVVIRAAEDMASEEEKTVLGAPLAIAQADGERTVLMGRAEAGRPRSGQRLDPGGRLGRRAAPTQEPKTVVLSALSVPAPSRRAPRAWSPDANPLLVAATPLLLLLGHLRSGGLDPRDGALPARLAAEFSILEQSAWDTGLDPAEVEDCLFVMAATVDDVMQNLPGPNRAGWKHAGLVARRFGGDAAEGGAFRRIELALVHPAAKARRLEVMLACLSLGLGGAGQDPEDARQLARWRDVVSRTLQQIAPRATGLSPCWHPVVPETPRDRRLPIWVAATVGALAALSLYLPLATDLSRSAALAESRIVGMHHGLPSLALVRQEVQERIEAPPETPQLDRLAAGVQGLGLALETRGAWVLLRLPAEMGFPPGQEDPTGAAPDVAATLGRVLDGETGPVRVVGHSDSLPLSGRGPFRTNAQLSAARAQTVADLLVPHLSDPSRLQPEGRGALEPIADNATPSGRAQNRRVEILIPRAP